MRVVSDTEGVLPYVGGWDELAIGAGRPFCAPAWMLGWWRHARTGDARLRIVLVFDARGSLAGIGPFFAQVGAFGLAEYRLLAAGFSHRIGPLARRGEEASVAAAIAQALALADPRPASVVFEGLDACDPWPELIATSWPGRGTRLRTDFTMDAPVIYLEGDYDAWIAARDRKFRKEARRTARRLQEHGVQARIVAARDGVDALMRLHRERWRERGGSQLDDSARRVILEADGALDLDAERIAVALLEGPDGPIAAELVVRAGSTVAFWAGGFDAAWSRHAPGTQAILAALADAAGREAMLADLGGGAHDYKQRLSDANAPLAWRTMFPLGIRYPVMRLWLAPKHVRFGLRPWFRRLPPALQSHIRASYRRFRGDRDERGG